MRQRLNAGQIAGRVGGIDADAVPAARQLRLRPTLDQVIEAVAEGAVGCYAVSKAALGMRGQLQRTPRLWQLVTTLHTTLLSHSR